MRFGFHDACLYGGLTIAATGLVWGLWTPAGVDTGYFPTLHRSAYGRGPLVLFDEGHWNQHRTNGTYNAFARLIERDGYRVVRNHQPIVPELLSGYHVLVVAGARSAPWGGAAFQPGEIAAIRNWVAAGGSVLLVASPGSGMGPLVEAFGVRVTGGAAEPGEVREFRVGGGVAEHPISLGRAEFDEEAGTVLGRAGSSFSIPSSGVPLLTYQGEKEGAVMAAVGEFGKGRTAIFGDATVLTAHIFEGKRVGINSRFGNRRFVPNLMHWLTRIL